MWERCIFSDFCTLLAQAACLDQSQPLQRFDVVDAIAGRRAAGRSQQAPLRVIVHHGGAEPGVSGELRDRVCVHCLTRNTCAPKTPDTADRARPTVCARWSQVMPVIRNGMVSISLDSFQR